MIMPMKLRTPPASALLAKAAGLPNGGGRPSSDAPVAKLAREQLREIARVKLPGPPLHGDCGGGRRVVTADCTAVPPLNAPRSTTRSEGRAREGTSGGSYSSRVAEAPPPKQYGRG
jgi:Ribosomal protein L11, RNA binding domain